MATVLTAFVASPLLLLFAIVAVGYPLGRVRIGGLSLGVAGVLFAGLAAGALHPDLRLPELVYQLGLVLFVYTMGLANGPTFFASFRRQGLRDTFFVAVLLTGAAGAVGGLARLLGLNGALAAGLFAGSLTNTPALAAVLESLRHSANPSSALAAQPIVAHSVAYAMGVVGMLVAIAIFPRVLRVSNRAVVGLRLRELALPERFGPRAGDRGGHGPVASPRRYQRSPGSRRRSADRGSDPGKQGQGALLFGAGAFVTLLLALTTLWAGYRLLRIPMAVLTGMLAAIQTQPAVLAFAQEQSDDDLPSVGFARVYPMAILLKIVLAQLLLAVV